jgi:antitoxin component HigA of HigAB toxin-antitoxin module
MENKFESLVTKEQIDAYIANKNEDKNGRPTKRPPLEVLVYLSDVLGKTTAEIAEIVGVRPSTIRVWRHLARKGEY